MSIDFKPNRGFVRRLERSRAVEREMERVARGAAEKVRAATPDVTGHARRSISADGNRVISTDSFWHIIEWGSVNSPPYAPMRRGIRAAGLRLDESRI